MNQITEKMNQLLTSKSWRAGFTMIELLVVVTIMIVLTTIGLVSYQKVSQNARNSKRKADIEMVRQALVLYKGDQTAAPLYPLGSGTASDFESMITTISSYISTTSVSDPKNTTPFEYTYSSDGSTFSVCTRMEPDSGSSFCVTNP